MTSFINQLELKNVQEDISSAQDTLRKINLQIEKSQKDAERMRDLSSDIESLLERKAEIESEISSVSEILRAKTEEARSARDEAMRLASASENKKEILAEIEALSRQKDLIKGDIAELSKKRDFAKSAYDSAKSSLDEFERDAAEKRKNIKIVADSYKDDIQEKVDEFDRISSMVSDARIELESVKKSVSEERSKLPGIAESIADLERKREEVEKAVIEEEAMIGARMREFEEKIAAMNADLEEKAGLLSKKESWIIEKENTLREIKKELEKYHNRPLPVKI